MEISLWQISWRSSTSPCNYTENIFTQRIAAYEKKGMALSPRRKPEEPQLRHEEEPQEERGSHLPRSPALCSKKTGHQAAEASEKGMVNTGHLPQGRVPYIKGKLSTEGSPFSDIPACTAAQCQLCQATCPPGAICRLTSSRPPLPLLFLTLAHAVRIPVRRRLCESSIAVVLIAIPSTSIMATKTVYSHRGIWTPLLPDGDSLPSPPTAWMFFPLNHSSGRVRGASSKQAAAAIKRSDGARDLRRGLCDQFCYYPLLPSTFSYNLHFWQQND